MAGDAQGVTHLAGYALRGPNDVPIVLSYHPAFIRRGKASHTGVLARNIQRALNIARGTDKDWLWGIDPEDRSTYGTLSYATHPLIPDCESFARYVLDNPNLVLSYDLETSESASLDEDAREGFADTHIRLVQFAVANQGAIAIPFEPGFIPAITAILHSPNTKCGHNVWLFDNKVLQAAGAREGIDLTPKGVIHDTLQMFHHFQPDLPAHLQFAASFTQFPFPWKHLAGSNLEFYGCCDVDATLRLFNMLERTLRRDGLWGDETVGYLGQVYHVRPVLAAMESRGMPIDDRARVQLGDEFEKAQGELGRELASLAPASCGRVHPKEGYKGVPPEVKAMMKERPPQYDSDREPPPYGLDEICALRYLDDGESYHYETRKFRVPMVGTEGEPETELATRWCRVYDFNPNSRPQVIAYMLAKGHPVPKDKHRENDAGDNPDTTKEKELLRLANKTGDTFYLKVIEYRGFTKLRGTYIDGFKPGPDGRVHTTFGFGTSIGQITSKNPNTQNFLKLKPTPQLAKAMRRMVAAEPGYIITEWDYKSFHVLTLGFLAEDPVWMRLARLDMHSFFAGHVLGLWDGPSILKESDAELLARFKWLKSNPAWKNMRDGQFKRCTLGIGNGLREKGLYERYMEDFPLQICKQCNGSGKVQGIRSLKKCPNCEGGHISGFRFVQDIFNAIYKLAPRIFAYQKAERRAAHAAGDRGYFSREYGFARRFYEVYNFTKNWQRKPDEEPPPGDQSEEAVSFRHTNIAHCEMRARMKELDQLGFAERYGMFNQIHDALQFHFPENLLEQHIADVHPVLTHPSYVLRHPTICPDGLVIDVEGSAGRDWSSMNELELRPKVMAAPLRCE